MTSSIFVKATVALQAMMIIGVNAKTLEGPYLGQETPGLESDVFAPGVVSTEHRDSSVFFSPDMKSMYFTRRDNITKNWVLITYTQENDVWRKASEEPRIGRPFMSPDGSIMHLGKRYKERTESGWSEVKSLGPWYEEIRIMRLTSSLNGTYVMDEGTRDGLGTLRFSTIIDGQRTPPQPLDETINTGRWNAHPFIAPDESYILWDGERETGFGGNDIYISFKQEDRSWGAAINLGGAVNTSAEESGAYITPDGKYLFFNSNQDVHWIDAKIISKLKH